MTKTGMNEINAELFDLAMEALKQTNGDMALAAGVMKPIITKQRRLREYLIYNGIRAFLQDATRALRLSTTTDILRRKAAEVHERLGILSAWRFEDGLVIQKATRQRLITEAEMMETVAVGLLERAIFYRRLAMMLVDDEAMVESLHLQDRQVTEMLQQCKTEARGRVS